MLISNPTNEAPFSNSPEGESTPEHAEAIQEDAGKKKGKKDKAGSKQSVALVVIVDRSGSMNGIHHDMEGGIASFLQELKNTQGAKTSVTLAQFDDQYELVHSASPIEQLEPYRLVPRGSTALHDAMGRTIAMVRAGLGEPGSKHYPQRVLALIVTDGMENASREWNLRSVRNLIGATKSEGWEYVFLAANQDAFEEGSKFGLARHETVDFQASAEDVGEVMVYASDKLSRIMQGAAPESLPDRETWKRDQAKP